MATVMALMEAVTLEGDDQKMQTGVDSLDKCSQISKSRFFLFCTFILLLNSIYKKEGMDECDTAALVMECGKNEFPELFDDMVLAADLATVV